MTPTIEEEALNTELQELYLITKQWSADLQFVHDDSDIIKNLSHKALQSEVIKKYLVKFNAQEQQLSKLKLKVIHLQKRLEPLTYGPIKNIKLSLIEEHQLLKREMENILLTFHETKNELLEHIAHD
ncbi:hypothetical protein AQ505_12695 [Pedobacter sp. PACM 27299]|uniref:hypothetical protein n=1 Tax=Pedobacter sp. PACM 27299 TaxID=1727164 RepID=UPI00070615B5|nr:hypothetical protein [Pedobacter sp. PACM 27299]ALL06277.1 hypothetical protein AQ505_12695 [Pedobacter sp. PACM 27299]